LYSKFNNVMKKENHLAFLLGLVLGFFYSSLTGLPAFTVTFFFISSTTFLETLELLSLCLFLIGFLSGKSSSVTDVGILTMPLLELATSKLMIGTGLKLISSLFLTGALPRMLWKSRFML